MDRRTVDLSAYPDLVVIYLGMRANTLRGVVTLLEFGRRARDIGKNKPDGLLAQDNTIYSLFPMHFGMRQYWRDFDSLEKWARSDPHRQWWQEFLKDPKGTGFWHEAYFRRGGMEAVYVNVPELFGFRQFAPEVPARGPMFSARTRAGREGQPAMPAPISEHELYGTPSS